MKLLKRMFPKFFLKNKIIIFEKRGNAIIQRNAYGRISRGKDGVEYLEMAYPVPNKFMMDLITIEPPEYSQYILDKKGRPVLLLVSPTQRDFRTLTPVEFTTIKELEVVDEKTGEKRVEKVPVYGIHLTCRDQGVGFWATQEHKKYREKYWKPTWIEKYGNLVFSTTAMALIFLMIIMTSRSLVQISGNLGGIASAVENAAQTFKAAASQISNTFVPPH